MMNQLWNDSIQYGAQVRASRKDGLAAWNMLKSHIPNITLKWKTGSEKIYEDLRALGVTGDDNDPKNELWEANHFLIQHGRIIKNNPEGTLVRLLQIAYNIGQYRSELEKDDSQTTYTPEMREYYHEHDLGELSSFLDESEIVRINRELESQKIYLDTKQAYLNLSATLPK